MVDLNFMLPKAERLKERYLFNLAFNLGKSKRQKLNSSLLSLYYLFRKKDISRFPKVISPVKTAFVVGLRIDKKAVKRNLVKRRMRASYRLVMKNIANLNKLSVLVWIANPPIKDATFEQIKNSMDNLLNKVVRFEK